jgi:hypothetical protein
VPTNANKRRKAKLENVNFFVISENCGADPTNQSTDMKIVDSATTKPTPINPRPIQQKRNLISAPFLSLQC